MKPHALVCLQAWPDNPELATWVRRQRALHSQGQLIPERHQILSALGFEFGEGAHITQEWESNFDQLVDWLLWQVRAHAFTLLLLPGTCCRQAGGMHSISVRSMALPVRQALGGWCQHL